MKISNLYKYALTLLGIKHDRDLSFNLMTKIAVKLIPEYRFSWPHMSWWRDKGFNEYLVNFGEDNGFNTHRRWMLVQLMRLTSDVSGDTVECGVYRGCSSYAILKQNDKSSHPRIHHVFDSFEGLSAPSENDNEYWSSGDLSVGEKIVQQNLRGFDSVRLYKGWIPERFSEVGNLFFSFVHVDVDLYEPTRDSIEFFYDRISRGGIFLCDDYGFDTCEGATLAVDEFLKDKPEKMISLADGGGFFVKGCVTSEG